MCRLASGKYRPDTQEIAVHDITSHGETEKHLNLNVKLWQDFHYLPNGEIHCRLPDNKRDEKMEAYIKERWPTFWDFFGWAVKNGCVSSDLLDLSGCDLSKVKELALPEKIGGSLDLSGCDLSKVKAWPKEIGGSLYLRGCDLSKVKAWPKEIGGSLYLSGCDLSKVKELALPEKIGGSLDLRGCDLSKVKIPERFKDKVIK